MNPEQPKTPRPVKCVCHKCLGSGWSGPVENPSKKSFCDVCFGSGTVQRPPAEIIPCPDCHGTGKLTITSGFDAGAEEHCVTCNGTGRIGNPEIPFHVLAKEVDNSLEARLASVEARLALIETTVKLPA